MPQTAPTAAENAGNTSLNTPDFGCTIAAGEATDVLPKKNLILVPQ